jgi:hypothetical protein
MTIRGATEKVRTDVLSWKGVAELPHRFGGIEFRYGKRELGHIHGNKLLDIPFPMNVRTELLEKGEVKKHHIMPESGWISFYIRKEEDVQKASALLRRSYDIAVELARKRKAMGYGAE